MFFRTLALAAAGLALVAPAGAQTAAYLERGQVLASGTQVQVFRLPTKDANGRIKYWDVTIDLAIGASGKPEATAAVASTVSPKFVGSDFMAGTYKDAWGYLCIVTTGFLDGGRQETAFSCPSYYGISGSWVSGPIAGHPLELELKAAGIDQIAGYENYAWGKVASLGTTNAWGCFSTNEIISARQVGSQIVITNYTNDNIADCGMTLTLQ